MRTLLCLIIFSTVMLISEMTFGQNGGHETKYYDFERIGFSSGSHIYFIKDELLSPVIYKGTTLPLNLYYDRSNRRAAYEVGLSFDKTTLESSVTEVKEFTETLEGHFSDYWSLSVYGHFMNKVYSKEKFRVLAGARLHGLGVYRLHTIVKALPWDIGYGFINFQAAVNLQKQLFKNHWIDIYAAYGLGALTMGNQYSRVFTGSEWLAAGKFNNLFTKITYNIPWTERLDSGFEYRFNYQSYEKDLPYQLVSHQILVLLSYRLE